MKKGIFKTLSITMSLCFVCSMALMFLILPILKKTSTTDTKYYGDFYQAQASEDTGADKVSSFYKGGSIYIGPNNTYTMKGGVVSGHFKAYGGAVYVSSGATFTMQGGVIESNSATYGGAIYVESGGTFIMTGGTIRNNSAKTAPAVYLEDGSVFTMTANCVIEDNYYIASDYNISEDTIRVGHLTNGTDMHYLDYGTYPQTYVGNTMNLALEAWYQAENPRIEQTYITSEDGDYGVWHAHIYTDGNLYVRGKSNLLTAYSAEQKTDYLFSTGESLIAKGEIVWLKVEPIRWIILNYDNIISGIDKTVNLLSYLVLTADVRYYPDIKEENCNLWYTSNMRNWLNTKFYQTAFNFHERAGINVSVINNESTVVEGEITYDYLYCLSLSEITAIFSQFEYRMASPTDFALSNMSFKNTTEEKTNTVQFKNGGSTLWWTRTPSDLPYTRCITSYGSTNPYFVDSRGYGIRPAMSLKI